MTPTTQINNHYLRQSIQSFQSKVDEPTKVFNYLERILTKNYTYQFEGRLTNKEFKKQLKSYLLNISLDVEFNTKFGLGKSVQDYLSMNENQIIADFKRHLRSVKQNERCR
jgi:hypothetical protein